MKLKPLKTLKELTKPVLVSIVFAAMFITYMLVIGIPKTRAAGYYELAIQQSGLGANAKANEFFNKAIESYPEEYIIKAYQKFKLSVL